MKAIVKVAENPTIMLVVALALGPKGGRWLVQKRPQDKPHGGLWEFPGGKVDQSEAIEIAVIREAKEELGIEISDEYLVPAGFAQDKVEGGQSEIVILLYTCAKWDCEPRSLEGGEVAWLTPDEIFRLKQPPLDIALRKQFFGKRRI